MTVLMDVSRLQLISGLEQERLELELELEV